MSSDVMQHELVERARESGTLTKADITKAWFIYWLGAEVSKAFGVSHSRISQQSWQSPCG